MHSALVPWNSFFTLLGESTASFAGLLFVALSLNATEYKKAENRQLMLIGKQTFFNLLILTVMALVSLFPATTLREAGMYIVIGSLGGIANCIAFIRQVSADGVKKLATRDMLRAIYGPSVLYVCWLATGIATYNHQIGEVIFLAGLELALLVVSARNAWLLLTVPHQN